MIRGLHRLAAAAAITSAATAVSAGAQSEVTVTASTVTQLQAKLQGFRSALSAPERNALTTLLNAAARAPAGRIPAGRRSTIRVARTYVTVAGEFGAGGVQGGPDPATDIVIRGRPSDVTDSVPAGARPTSKTINVTAGASVGSGVVVQSGGTSSKTIIVPREGTGALKPSDARDLLHGRLLGFAETLTVAEAATLDWMIQRATSRQEALPLPAGPAPTLAQALGIRWIGTGRSPGDRRPPPAGFRALLRF